MKGNLRWKVDGGWAYNIFVDYVRVAQGEWTFGPEAVRVRKEARTFQFILPLTVLRIKAKKAKMYSVPIGGFSLGRLQESHDSDQNRLNELCSPSDESSALVKSSSKIFESQSFELVTHTTMAWAWKKNNMFDRDLGFSLQIFHSLSKWFSWHKKLC